MAAAAGRAAGSYARKYLKRKAKDVARIAIKKIRNYKPGPRKIPGKFRATQLRKKVRSFKRMSDIDNGTTSVFKYNHRPMKLFKGYKMATRNSDSIVTSGVVTCNGGV